MNNYRLIPFCLSCDRALASSMRAAVPELGSTPPNTHASRWLPRITKRSAQVTIFIHWKYVQNALYGKFSTSSVGLTSTYKHPAKLAIVHVLSVSKSRLQVLRLSTTLVTEWNKFIHTTAAWSVMDAIIKHLLVHEHFGFVSWLLHYNTYYLCSTTCMDIALITLMCNYGHVVSLPDPLWWVEHSFWWVGQEGSLGTRLMVMYCMLSVSMSHFGG